MPRAAILAALSLLAACGGSRGKGDGGGDAGPFDAGAYLLAVLPPGSPAGSCDAHAEQPSHFVDATDAWGLGKDGGLAMVGNRIVSVDLDRDGYPDLVVHAIDTMQREPMPSYWDGGWHNESDGGFVRLVSVLMNRPRPGGGRMFVDATVASGLFQIRGGSTTELRNAQLATVADVNGDGAPDVFSGTYLDGNNPQKDPGDRSEILLNDGRGHFTLAPQSDPSQMKSTWATTGATFLDFDRDGIPDLFVGFWYDHYGTSYVGSQARLYKGKGDGTFGDVTDELGLATDGTGSEASLVAGTNARPSYGVTACDLNGDGQDDLLVGAYGREWNLLYQSQPSGAYVEEGQDAGYAGDLLRDYHDNQFFLCYCTVHSGDADCADAGAPLVVCPSPADSAWDPVNGPLPWLNNGNTFTTVCRDMDGDGRPDLYSAIIRHWWAGQGSDPAQLLLNATEGGPVTFDRVPNPQSGLVVPHPDPQTGWDEGLLMAAAVDLDNDGRPDLVVAASDYDYQFGLVYVQQPDGTFQEVGQSWGLHHPCMSGLSVADFDRDGDLDVIVGSGTARTCSSTAPGGGGWTSNEIHLYENDASRHGGWLEVRLRGASANTMGIGARVTVTANGVSQVQEMQSGYGHMAMGNDIGVLFFGLGACGSVDEIEVRWPDANLTTERWHDVPAGHFVELHQGDPNAYAVVLQ